MNLLNLLMGSAQSSLKVIDIITGDITISNTITDSGTDTFTNEYGSDDIILYGFVDQVYSDDPTQDYGFNIPYVDALGQNIFWVEWTSSNIYARYSNNGNVGVAGTQTATYTILVMVP